MKTKRLLLSISALFLLLPFTLPAAWPLAGGGGDRAGNGGGLAEQNLQFAYLSLPRIYQNCLDDSTCLQDSRLAQTLKAIRDSLPREARPETGLVFDSERKHPGRFLVDGVVRVAVTGDRVGDPIILNLDLLYSRSVDGTTSATDLGTAISILTHELGHHQGAFHDPQGERFLDALGASVRAHAGRSIEVLQADDWNRLPEDFPARIQLTVIHSSAAAAESSLDGPQSSLLLSDGAQAYPLDQDLLEQLRCPVRGGLSGRLIGYRLHDLSWKNWRASQPGSSARIYPLESRAQIECRYPDDDVYPTFYADRIVRMEFKFALPKSSEGSISYRYVKGSLRVTLVSAS